MTLSNIGIVILYTPLFVAITSYIERRNVCGRSGVNISVVSWSLILVVPLT